jgi:hypothetical protein
MRVDPVFTQASVSTAPRQIYRAVVQVDTTRFLIYGLLDPLALPNQLLLKIKPSSIWKGEIIVFVLGTRVPTLSQPASVKRSLHNAAIRL